MKAGDIRREMDDCSKHSDEMEIIENKAFFVDATEQKIKGIAS